MNKRTAKRIRQNNHRIETLTKGKTNDTTHIKRANAAKTDGRG